MKSLKGKLILATCVICIVCLGITVSVSYFSASGELKSKESENALLLAKKSASQIETWIEKQTSLLDTIASSIEVTKTTEHEELCTYLASLLEKCNKEDTLYDIYYTSMKNKMAAASGYVQEPGIDFTQRSWFTGALNTEGIYYEPPYKDVDSGRIVITLSRKITVNGNVAGILAEDIFIDTVIDIVNQCEVPANSYAMLLDQNLGVAVHPNEAYGYVDDEPVPLQSLAGNPYENLIPIIKDNTSEAVSVADYDNTTRVVFAVPVQECKWTLLIAVDKSVLNMAVTTMLRGFVIAIVVSLFTGIVIISLVTGQIVKPIKRLADTVESRDFSSEIKITSKDEIGRLANGFNAMFQNLKRLLTTFEEAAKNIKKASIVLGDITKEVVDGADNVKDKMDGISDTVGMQNQSVAGGRERLDYFESQIGTFHEQFADMKHIVNDVSSRIVDNAAVTKELETSTTTFLENMENLQSGVQRLQDKSHRITEIIETITEISSQTNLLALNASIEAARAGEAGKGFAVVADEIRNLSEQTEDASENIRLLIQEIQLQIGKTVNGIENAAELFETNSKVAGKVKNVFGEINDSIAAMDKSHQELSANLQTFVEAKDNITTAFGAIEDSTTSCLSYSEQALHITEKQAESVFQLKEFAQQLDDLSGELNEKLESF